MEIDEVQRRNQLKEINEFDQGSYSHCHSRANWPGANDNTTQCKT